jgi:hypothetical protein
MVYAQIPQALITSYPICCSCRHAPLLPVYQVLAAPEVQWLLCFQLACICQELQHKSKQQQQPWEQLFAALGLLASDQHWPFFGPKADAEPVSDVTEMAMTVLVSHLQSSVCVCQHKLAASGTAAAAAAAATSPHITQQQQQQQQRHFAATQPEEFCILPMQLVQPLLLTVLQLCSERKPTMLGVVLRSLHLADELLTAVLESLWFMQRAAKCNQDKAVSAPVAAGSPAMQRASTDPPPTATDLRQAYHNALHAMAQPLLHSVAPAVFRAVRQVEQGLSRAAVSGSSFIVQVGTTAEQKAAALADQVDELLQRFGRLVLRLVCTGKCCCRSSCQLAMADRCLLWFERFALHCVLAHQQVDVAEPSSTCAHVVQEMKLPAV